VRSCDVAQHALFAQHASLQAFSLGVFERIHEAAGSRADAPKSATATITDVPILLTTTGFNSTLSDTRRMRDYAYKIGQKIPNEGVACPSLWGKEPRNNPAILRACVGFSQFMIITLNTFEGVEFIEALWSN
jgi:hypothetical protein